MRAVITGGGGFIGSHIAARLVDDGHEAICLDIEFPDYRRAWWSKAEQDHVNLLNDIPRELFEGADIVFHMAADMGGVGYFHSDRDSDAAQANLHMDLNVLDACRATGTPLFYPSSACVYPPSTRPLHEGMIDSGPADRMYGEEKRFMTLLLAQEPLARVGIFHTIYGPGQEWDGVRAKFPGAICRKVKAGGRISIWGNGRQARTFLYIDDAVEKILTVALAERYDGPVNIGSDELVTVRQCANWLCDHAGVHPNFRFESDKPTGRAIRGCDNHRYDRLYDRPDQVSARDGLIRMFEWVP